MIEPNTPLSLNTMKVSFLSLLALVFIILKLTGHIAWSWWWVLCPLWGGFLLGMGFLLFVAFLGSCGIGRRRY